MKYTFSKQLSISQSKTMYKHQLITGIHAQGKSCSMYRNTSHSGNRQSCNITIMQEKQLFTVATTLCRWSLIKVT